MEYVTVHYTTYLAQTLALLQHPGLLLVAAGADGRPNAMTIGWATVGVLWEKPIFTVLVRPSRYTYSLMEDSSSFTVCVPAKSMKQAVAICGSRSGRDIDKFGVCRFTPLPSTWVATPGIEGCPVIYECQTVHTNDVAPERLTAEIQGGCYPRGDYHRIYYGEIMATRALPNAAELLAP